MYTCTQFCTHTDTHIDIFVHMHAYCYIHVYRYNMKVHELIHMCMAASLEVAGPEPVLAKLLCLGEEKCPFVLSWLRL